MSDDIPAPLTRPQKFHKISLKWKTFFIVRKFISGAAHLVNERKKKQQALQSVELDEDHAFLVRQFGDSVDTRSYINKIPEDKNEDTLSELSNASIAGHRHNGRSSDHESFYEEDDELEDELMKHPFKDFVVDPTGDLYYAWQGVVGISVFYNIVFTIMRIAFEQLEYYWWVFWVCDIVTDVIYAADMVVQMNISFIDDGIYVTDKSQLKLNYLKTRRFNSDAVSILPLPYVSLLVHLLYWVLRTLIGLTDIGLCIPVSEITLIGFCRLPRLIKYKALSEFFTSMESRTNAPDTFRAFNLIVYLLVIIHWIACIYYCISWYEGFGMNGWVYPATEEGEAEHMFLRKYTVCFYWSFLTLTTIGGSTDPETNLEYLFTGLTFFNGVFVFAAVVGNVGDVISNMNAARTEFQSKMDDIKRYMVHHKVPDTLQKRVKKWFDYSWARTHGVDESSLLETLPDKLRARIQIQIHLKTLKKVAIFEKCENGLLCELVLKLRLQIFSPRDYVCRRNELGKEMYIINHGKLECIVTTESGERIVVATLTEGKYFGEIALLSFEGNNRRTADVRSVGYSELLVLSKKALMSALVDYPEARKQLEYQAQLRISSNRKMSSALNSSSSTRGGSSKSLNGTHKSVLLKQSLYNQPSSQKINSPTLKSAKKSPLSQQSDSVDRATDLTTIKKNQKCLEDVLTELRTFDSVATRHRLKVLEDTISDLKVEILNKNTQCEEANSKLQKLEKLHLDSLPSVAMVTTRQNGHSTPSNGAVSVSHHARMQRFREFEARLDGLSPIEEKVSDRTRKVLETLRRQQLTNSQTNSSNNVTADFQLSRQTSFSVDTCHDKVYCHGNHNSNNHHGNINHHDNDNQQDNVTDNVTVKVSNAITQLVKDQEDPVPTVIKYFKNIPAYHDNSVEYHNTSRSHDNTHHGNTSSLAIAEQEITSRSHTNTSNPLRRFNSYFSDLSPITSADGSFPIIPSSYHVTSSTDFTRDPVMPSSPHKPFSTFFRQTAHSSSSSSDHVTSSTDMTRDQAGEEAYQIDHVVYSTDDPVLTTCEEEQLSDLSDLSDSGSSTC